IPIAYSNVPVAYPRSDFQSVLFTDAPGSLNRAYSLKSYYEELSNGAITLDGRVFDPVRMDTTDVYYQDGCNGIGVNNTCPNGGQRFGGMLIATLDSISNRPGADTVWNAFDNDGPDGLPNSGDDDGVVDFVTFLHPTVGGECTRPGIWAHRWVISGWTGGSPYVTKTPRRDASGQPIPNQFLRVSDYTIQSQLGGDTGCSETAIMPIGTIAHETGHAFGLPDLYDTGSSPRSQGIGEWGLMGSGNFAKAYSPASYEAWSVAELGWVTVAELSANQVVTTGPRALSDTVFLARTPSLSQYFLLENRQPVHSDSAQMNPAYSPASRRKLPGLLVWLIDEDRIAQGRSSNRVNTGAVQGVALMQADGLNQLRTPGSSNRGDVGDSYPGSTANTRFGFSTNPSSRTNFGEYAGFAIDQIEQLSGMAVRFRFTRREPSLFLSDRAGATLSINGQVLNRYQEVVPQGDQLVLSVDTLQSSNGGRSVFQFLSWSNGGLQTQQYTSGPVPDTVRARFAAKHRLRAQAAGGGTISASLSGDFAGAGILVDEGVKVSLTAGQTSGLVFLGWQGDTVATSPALSLSMNRPYDLTAVFLAEQVIPVDDAAAELLGTPRLTVDQRDYLDQLGNRNLGYDVGDYLAHLR
ncbi:MAG TPA: M6 family metalloprotease domain-containing protein, partial [Gemmatimonadales bacterium]|nr:M6 family metalloprotease domain-containing protein [Gemmatimonadales bacterium]